MNTDYNRVEIEGAVRYERSDKLTRAQIEKRYPEIEKRVERLKRLTIGQIERHDAGKVQPLSRGDAERLPVKPAIPPKEKVSERQLKRDEGVRLGGLPTPEGKPPEDVPPAKEQRIPEPIPIRRPEPSVRPDVRADEQPRPRPPHRVGAGEGPDISSKRRRAADTRGNYRITEADELETGGKVTKFDRNISAISLLKQIESKTRKASPEEKKSFVKLRNYGLLSLFMPPYAKIEIQSYNLQKLRQNLI